MTPKIKIIPAILIFLALANQALAVCPVCTIAVVGGVSLSEYLGVDNTIAGIWIGGLIISLFLWTLDWLDKRSIKFFLRKPLVLLGYYALIYYSLEYAGMLNGCQTLWGQNKLVLGMLLGMFGFSLGVIADKLLRRKNSDKVFFPFQKVVMPISGLAILSVIFYFITKC